MGGLVTERSLRLDPMNDDAFDRNRNLQAQVGSLVEPSYGRRGGEEEGETSEYRGRWSGDAEVPR